MNNPCTHCLGGKAGISFYNIQVGEVQNLYKSGKRLHSHNTGMTPTLDLHGYTRDQALVELDKCLINWYETAMRGSYPFVMKVKVISGCGNQILSEAVQEWIKLNKKVSKAPKNN